MSFEESTLSFSAVAHWQRGNKMVKIFMLITHVKEKKKKEDLNFGS